MRQQIAPSKNRKQDGLLATLVQLLQDTLAFNSKIAAQVSAIIHSSEQNSSLLSKECGNYLFEFNGLSQLAHTLKVPVEERISALKQKGPMCFAEPIPATRFQSIVILHLVSEQSLAKRSEELALIRKRQQDFLLQLEQNFKSVQDGFAELVARLNLFLYMRDCLEKDGALPANVMYNSSLPQVVSSPFCG